MKKSSIVTPPPKAIIVATAKAVIVATAKAVIVATAKAVIVATAKAWGYKSKLISMGAAATFNLRAHIVMPYWKRSMRNAVVTNRLVRNPCCPRNLQGG